MGYTIVRLTGGPLDSPDPIDWPPEHDWPDNIWAKLTEDGSIMFSLSPDIQPDLYHYKLVSKSLLTAEQVRGNDHIARGAVYRYHEAPLVP